MNYFSFNIHYLNDIPFEIKFENTSTETPFIEIKKKGRTEIVEYDSLFENFRRKKTIRIVCKSLQQSAIQNNSY